MAPPDVDKKHPPVQYTDDDDPYPYDDTIEVEFDKIIDGIKNGKHGLQDLIDPQNEYHQYLKEKISSEGSLLHKIVRCDKSSVDTLKPLMDHLAKEYPDLMMHKDTDGMTPLHTAIKKSVYKFVEGMCNTINAEEIDNVLSIPDSSNNNCLHSAMRNKGRDARTIASYLIDRVHDKNLLRNPNKDGQTPLHIAVEYERCTAKQLAIVSKLVDSCDEALDVNIFSKDSRLLSVYRYHEKTRREYLRSQNEAEARTEGNKEKGRLDQHQQSGIKHSKSVPAPQASNQSVPRETIGPRKPERYPATAPEFVPQPLSRMKTLEEMNVGGRTINDELRPARVNGKVGGTSLHNPGLESQTLSLEAGKKEDEERKKKQEEEKKKRKEQEKVREKWANEIRDLLKRSFMRNREDHEAMVSFFYGPIQEKELSFSLVGGPAKCTEEMLKNMQFAEFEDTLQYVELPRLELEKPDDVPAKFRGRVSPKDGKGRNDYAFIFDWLRKKGVHRILRLDVDDSEEPSHSDETIENALESFTVVQLWDWRKFDLSSETILKAARDVEQVCLYWSGNNAILRSWSEPEGLNALKSLKKVTVHETQGLENRARVKKNLDAFSERLKQNRDRAIAQAKDAANERKSEEEGPMKAQPPPSIPPEIEVKLVRDESVQRRHEPGTGLPATLGPPQKQHKWLSDMDEFTYFHQMIELDDTGSATLKPTTVALIDDGFDIGEPELNGRIIGGRSFCRSNSKNHHAPYFVTLGGHGTVMAKLICRICPRVRLFVLRLDEHLSPQGRRQITAKSAEKAVRAAIDKGVDIISMSWTIKKTDSNKDDIARLETTLEEAANKKSILLFCAASDEGPDSGITYPAATGRCIRIGAARASGKEHEWLGGPVDFLFPGHNVLPGQPGEIDVRLDKGSLLTGSSVATALAAGLAALVLHCVRFAAQYASLTNMQGDRVTLEDLAQRKTRDGMCESFQMIGTTEASKRRYVEVWNVFGSAAKKEDGQLTPEAKRRVIVDVARRLVQKRML